MASSTDPDMGGQGECAPGPGVPHMVPPVRSDRVRRRVFVLILVLLVFAAIVGRAILYFFGPTVYFIPAESMEPTLLGHDAGTNPVSGITHSDTVHDHILVDRFAYRSEDPHCGDIIVFNAPEIADLVDKAQGAPLKENLMVKRVIGVPGDTIEVKNGAVYRNGRKLNEAYKDDQGVVHRNGSGPLRPYFIKEPMEKEQPGSAVYGVTSPLKLAPGQLFVLGDNRNDSNDSRFWGSLDIRRVIGKVTNIIFPLHRARAFP